ncbi:biotin transporter BioY [Streptomyces bohaiensis]|uniref:Biotin transporter n=2 Tax=Streptomyces bohaiensis TaxID=1431344 RepID=A0ABX1C9L4_9ACTN|nr:biotin transporter BioY [Streptomyces bohaiensis]
MSGRRTAGPRLEATDLARVAVFAGMTAVLGLPGGFSAFGGVPVTAQTLGVMLAGAILGPWLGALSMTTLVVLVAAGMPLLAGGRGGAGVLLGPTGGYVLGWIVGAFVIGALVHAGGRRPVWWRTFLGTVVGGILVVYAVGMPVQSAVTRLPLEETVLVGLALLPGDLVKAVVATLVVNTLVRAYPRAFRRQWRSGRGPAAEPAAAR